MRKRKIAGLLGILVSLFFLYLACRKVEVSELFASMRRANLVWFVPSMLFYCGDFFFRTVRWHYLLKPLKRCPLSHLFSSLMIGFMVNNVLPLRIGEFARAYIHGKKDNISVSASFATIVVERVFDGLCLTLILAAVSFIFPFPGWVKKVGWIAFFLFAAVLTLLAGLMWKKDKMRSIVMKLFFYVPHRWKEKMDGLLGKFVSGLDVLRGGTNLLWAFLLSIAVWCCEGLTFFFAMRAFAIHAPLYAGFFVMAVVGLSLTIPSSPGFVGVYEYFSIAGLSLFAVPKETALSFALTLHAFQYVPIVLIGILFLAREHLTLWKIQDAV